MYTKRPIQPTNEPLRLPEHYSGVAFSRKSPSAFPEIEEPLSKEAPKTTEEKSADDFSPKEEKGQIEESAEAPTKKQNSLLGIGSREDILLLILAMLLLDDEGGDDMLAYILLGLLFLG